MLRLEEETMEKAKVVLGGKVIWKKSDLTMVSVRVKLNMREVGLLT